MKQHMKKGILLVNLGTPNKATFSSVFHYLIEFLTDKRVIDIPRIQRELLVRGVIVPFRTKSSLNSYLKIWKENGSPLKIYSENTTYLLAKELGDEFIVKLAMRYQSPSINSVIQDLLKEELSELIILPLFPQYASATTGSIFEEVMRCLLPTEIFPKLTFIDHFYSEETFIKAFISRSLRFNLSSYDHILFSFHGLPVRQLKKGNKRCLTCVNCCQLEENRNCYSNQCYKTAELIAKELKLSPSLYSVCFQSRLGKDPWTAPSTQETIERLGSEGKKRILVFCPSFVADCLETLYEIEMEYKELFQELGGETLDLVPSLNDSPDWIFSLKDIILKNLSK